MTRSLLRALVRETSWERRKREAGLRIRWAVRQSQGRRGLLQLGRPFRGPRFAGLLYPRVSLSLDVGCPGKGA